MKILRNEDGNRDVFTGEVLDLTKQMGIDDNTYILYTSDVRQTSFAVQSTTNIWKQYEPLVFTCLSSVVFCTVFSSALHSTAISWGS